MEQDLVSTGKSDYRIQQGQIIDLASALQFYVEPHSGQRFVSVNNQTGNYFWNDGVASRDIHVH